jgi:lipopolysaccharide transport system ATP-binding protein
MNDIAIRVENLYKRYRIGTKQASYGSLRESLMNAVTAPIQRIQKNNVGTQDSSPDHIWALKDISLEVKRGEAVGIIGRNGAGKSTLLKILSRITKPTAGRAVVRGRVGSLLEVGTGFHPELTGRENIYLNGAVLGMRRAEIDQKFDEIVTFAEIEKFLETPVKHYSSGMYMRLAFAVAAHLEPEILLVDEVLAVGDAAFQKKCLGKMGAVAKGGRTVLFVSHNMPAVVRLCTRAIWLHQGDYVEDGDSSRVTNDYVKEFSNAKSEISLSPDPEKAMRLRRIMLLDDQGIQTGRIELSRPFRIRVEYDINRPVSGAHVICFIKTAEGINILGSGDSDCSPDRLGQREPGSYIGEFKVPGSLLGEGTYSITVSLSVPFVQVYDRHEMILDFEIFDNSSKRRMWQHNRRPGILGLEIPWHLRKVR